MSYGGRAYAGGVYAGEAPSIITTDTETALAVEVAFTTDPLATPTWVDVTADVRGWEIFRGRNRELERFQPGRATVILANREAQYDSLNTGGAYYGNLKPMKRIRIRETFNGVTYPVFDGFVDKWQLDYPGVGKDAICVVTATDQMKIWARTELDRSVYTIEVKADDPIIWWRLDETRSDPTTSAINEGSFDSTGNGVYVGPVKERGVQGLVFHDAGTAIETAQPLGIVPEAGVTIDGSVFDLSDYGSWAIEFWTVSTDDLVGTDRWVQGENGAGNARLAVQSSSSGQKWQFRVTDSGDLAEYGVTGNAEGQVAGTRYHVVAKFGPNNNMAIYVNGTKYTTTATGTTAPPLVGVIHPDMDLGLLYSFGDGLTPDAIVDEFAIYVAASSATDPLSDARVAAHYAAGNTPWDGDLPSERIDRVLDLMDIPSDLRELDAGVTTFQSAEISGQTALEHIQKAAETEYAGLLFVARDGKARFIDREAVLAREPYPIAFGDSAGEVGYTSFVPDDGDEVIRNRAKVSRLNGAVKTSEDSSSLSAFGPFEFVLEGTLADSEQNSADYAAFVVDQYADQRRRITTLDLGPPITGDEDLHYPAVLGPELGDAITVRNNPLGGIAFEQVCVVEGIRQVSGADKVRTTTFLLSPELT